VIAQPSRETWSRVAGDIGSRIALDDYGKTFREVIVG